MSINLIVAVIAVVGLLVYGLFRRLAEDRNSESLNITGQVLLFISIATAVLLLFWGAGAFA